VHAAQAKCTPLEEVHATQAKCTPLEEVHAALAKCTPLEEVHAAQAKCTPLEEVHAALAKCSTQPTIRTTTDFPFAWLFEILYVKNILICCLIIERFEFSGRLCDVICQSSFSLNWESELNFSVHQNIVSIAISLNC